MNAHARPHPAAPRMPLVLSIVLVFLSVLGTAYVLRAFFGGADDPWLARPLGAPATALVLLACGWIGSRWFFSGELVVDARTLTAATLLALSLAGVLGAAQGADAAAQRWGGVAGRNLNYLFLERLGWSAAVPQLLFGATFLFGLVLARRAAAASAPADRDASAVLARLARERSGDRGVAGVEVAPPAPEEALGFPRPVGVGERDLFGAESELADAPVAVAEEPGPDTAFVAGDDAEEPVVAVVEEPPPPPKRRRVLRDLIDEESFAAEAAQVPEAAPPVAAAAAEPEPEPTRAFTFPADADRPIETPFVAAPSEFFGQGVVDVADDEDLVPPPVAAPTTAPVDATPPVVVADDRERLEDVADSDGEAEAEPREVEVPLFAPPPRFVSDDEDVGDVDDLPTDDDASALAAPAPQAGPTADDPDAAYPAPPPRRPFAEDEDTGGRTGEAPRRALTVDEPAPSVEADAAAQAGLFPDAEEEAAPVRRRRARTARVRKDAAEEASSSDADAPPVETPAFVAAEPPTPPSAPEIPAVVAATPGPVAVEATPPVAPLREATARRPAPAPARTTLRPVAAAADDFEVLVRRATEVVVGAQRCSPSLLQRELGIRFVEAAAVIERLHARGIVGPHTPSGVRDVLVAARGAEA